MQPHAINILTLLSLPSFIAAQALSNSSIPSECSTICKPIVELTTTCSGGTMNMITDMSSMNSDNTPDMNMGKDGNPMTNVAEIDAEKIQPMGEMAAQQEGAIMMSAGKRDQTRKKRQDAAMEMVMCVCENKSFDVSKVMGLCSSCMEMNVGSGNKTAVENVSKIMSECKFPATSYAPSATSVVAGVSVQATMPSMTMSMTGMSMTMSMTGTSTSMAGMGEMSMGAAGKLEVATGVWGVGMVMASVGLGVGLVFGML